MWEMAVFCVKMILMEREADLGFSSELLEPHPRLLRNPFRSERSTGLEIPSRL